MRFEYPAGLFAYDRPKLFALEFQGTLVLDKEDGAHTLYRRNRTTRAPDGSRRKIRSG